MSSNYSIFCLNHDPAIMVVEDLPSPNEALALAARRDREALAEHRDCDLLVGRHSGALVEMACPGMPHHRSHYQNADTWTDLGWLRLLHAAHVRGDSVEKLHLPSCWTRDRVMRLGPWLDTEESR